MLAHAAHNTSEVVMDAYTTHVDVTMDAVGWTLQAHPNLLHGIIRKLLTESIRTRLANSMHQAQA